MLNATTFENLVMFCLRCWCINIDPYCSTVNTIKKLYSNVTTFCPGNHYTWRKVTTTVHNIIVGKLWLDQHGDMDIINHKDGSKCKLTYIPYSYFTRDVQRKVRLFFFEFILQTVMQVTLLKYYYDSKNSYQPSNSSNWNSVSPENSQSDRKK